MYMKLLHPQGFGLKQPEGKYLGVRCSMSSIPPHQKHSESGWQAPSQPLLHEWLCVTITNTWYFWNTHNIVWHILCKYPWSYALLAACLQVPSRQSAHWYPAFQLVCLDKPNHNVGAEADTARSWLLHLVMKSLMPCSDLWKVLPAQRSLAAPLNGHLYFLY